MLKKLICFMLGHKTVLKAYTGNTVQARGVLGNDFTISLYEWRRMDFCVRCGKKDV